MGVKTPLRHIGTIKVTNITSTVTFANVTAAASGYNIDLGMSGSSASDPSYSGTWRLNFRIYFRALGNGNGNSNYYGSYPYIYADNQSYNWDRSGYYYQTTAVNTNTTINGWNSSPSYTYNGGNFGSPDLGAIGTNYGLYQYSNQNVSSSLAESDSQWDHGYIDYNFGYQHMGCMNAHSFSIRPSNNDTASNAPIAINDNTSVGAGMNASTNGPYNLHIYNGTNWAAGSTFVCYAWDSKDINE